MSGKKKAWAFLALDLLLLLCTAALIVFSFFQPRLFPTTSGFPFWSDLFAGDNTGESFGISVEYLGLDRVAERDGSKVDVIRFKIKTDHETPWDHSFSIHWKDGEECGTVYSPFSNREDSLRGEVVTLKPGENFMEVTVPHGLFARKGRYFLYVYGVGCELNHAVELNL